MQIIVGARQCGKTLKLIEISDKEQVTIVCFSSKECSRVFNLAKKMGKNIPFPICYDEYCGGKFYPPGISGFVIDNSKTFLEYFSKNVPVKAATIDFENNDNWQWLSKDENGNWQSISMDENGKWKSNPT